MVDVVILIAIPSTSLSNGLLEPETHVPLWQYWVYWFQITFGRYLQFWTQYRNNFQALMWHFGVAGMGWNLE
ncbi:hypothetical protein L873DRAFT_1011337 [Choiromyces venosus 120613-1]|uniref:Uncharacterized protein n=1 Tax=Choiromyces venosus 120613-1 TaxID=1336337 RepID=A0A3N4JRK5_9PEZI|nr:hypothetical protein L873DRAFT_1011337 [Choiromyces venosus 120613-1]